MAEFCPQCGLHVTTHTVVDGAQKFRCPRCGREWFRWLVTRIFAGR